MGGGASVEEEYPEESEEEIKQREAQEFQERKEQFLEFTDKEKGEFVIALRHESGLAPEGDFFNDPNTWNFCYLPQPHFGKPFELFSEPANSDNFSKSQGEVNGISFIRCPPDANFVAFSSMYMTQATVSVVYPEASKESMSLYSEPFDTVHWSNGEYAESSKPWEDVVEMDNSSSHAYTVIPLKPLSNGMKPFFSSWKNLRSLVNNNLITVSIKHHEGVTRQGQWCMNGIVFVDENLQVLPHTLENSGLNSDSWVEKGKEFSVMCSAKAKYLAFSSQDMEKAVVTLKTKPESSTVSLPSEPINTVHWSHPKFCDDDNFAGHLPETWAYTVVSLFNDPQEPSYFAGYANIGKK